MPKPLYLHKWLTEKHYKYWTATTGMKFFGEGPLRKFSRDLMALERKQCRQVKRKVVPVLD
jgi:hypothetical protein